MLFCDMTSKLTHVCPPPVPPSLLPPPLLPLPPPSAPPPPPSPRPPLREWKFSLRHQVQESETEAAITSLREAIWGRACCGSQLHAQSVTQGNRGGKRLKQLEASIHRQEAESGERWAPLLSVQAIRVSLRAPTHSIQMIPHRHTQRPH